MKPYPEYKDSGVQWLEEIPVSWSVNKLKYMTAFQTGWTPPTKNPEYFIGSNVWVTITDLNRKFISDSIQKISDEAVKIARMAITPKGSLMYSFKLSLGKVAFANRDLYTNEAIISIKPQNDIDLNYLYYCLPSQLLNNANENIYGAKILNQELMRNTFLVFSSLPEQKQIAKYLNYKTAKIDSLIEKKKRLIELLKEERTAVINQAVTKGLDPDVPMKDSGLEWLGEIPAHWEIGTLKYFLKVIDCKHITAEFFEEGFPLVSIKEVQSWEVNLTNAKFTNEVFYRVLIGGNRKPVPGDIIYSRNATVGEAALVTTKHPDLAMGQDVCLLRPEDKIISKFILFQLKSKIVLNQLELLMVGATFKRINVEDIKNYHITVPPIYEQSEISEYLLSQTSKIDSIMAKSEKEIESLQEYRTALISEVVTGKIDVREEKT